MKRLCCLWIMLLWLVCLPAAAEETLCVSNLMACPPAVETFQQKYPSIQLMDSDTMFESQEKFVSMLLTKDKTVDIYAITVSMGLDALKQKHYLPVIASPVIEAEMSGWYPPILDCLSTSEGIVAVPYQLTTNEWGINQPLWDQLNLQADLTTWREYLELVIAWQEREDLSEEYSLSYSGLSREDVARSMVFSYISYYETQDSPLDFDTSAFKECLLLLTQLPAKQDTEEDEEAWNYRLNLPTLINEVPENIGSLANAGHLFTAIPEPRFEKDTTPVVRGEMQMYVLNPHSKHKEAAVHFLEAVLETMPDEQRIRFSPLVETPIENPDWAQYHQRITDELQALEKRGDALTDAEKNRMEILQQQLLDETDRYIVTAEESERYQQLAAFLTFREQSCFLGFQNGNNVDALMLLIKRYLSGTLSLDGCVQELNRIATQVFFEQ